MANAGASTLAARLRDGEFIVAPGVFDLISARIADRMGFPALYMTGWGTVASHLGLPDAGIATYTEMLSRAAQIVRRTDTPLIADADTGYGGVLNVRHTVQGYEAAGVAAIQLEDQAYPKKCGHTAGHKLIPADEMVAKIKAAVASRDSRDFLVVARTDARKVEGIDEALRRGALYADAGADILFIEAPGDMAELERVGHAFPGMPLLANMVDGGSTPVLGRDALRDLGFQVAIYPVTGVLAAAKALQDIYGVLGRGGTADADGGALYSFEGFNELMGFGEEVAFESRYEK